MKLYLLVCLSAMVIMMCQAHMPQYYLISNQLGMNPPVTQYTPAYGYGGLGGGLGGGIGGGISAGIGGSIGGNIGAGAYGYGGYPNNYGTPYNYYG